MTDTLLLWLVILPVLGALACIPFSERLSKYIALAFSLVGVALGIALWCAFDASQAAHLQMVFSIPWIPAYNVHFALGVDGISFPLVVLTKLMIPIAILGSWYESRRARAFMTCFLILDAAMTGTFLATDIFLFYVFWELMLIPMLLLIGVWGSTDRIYAALKFFIFTFAGSILMLAAIFYLYVVQQKLATDPVIWGLNPAELVFLGFTLAFLIKVPLFPLHTWLPDAHVQAPTGGSVLLAAVLLKMGTYGLLRFSIPIAPDAFVRFTPPLAILALIGIFYGAWVALQQTDMKKLVAYSSVSHLGIVVLGICAHNPEALSGAMLQMINHGLSTGALFLLVGMLYERRHSRDFADFGGLAEVLPWYAFFLVFVACSSMGVPGLNGFVGEFLVLFGTFRMNMVWGGIAALSVVFGAAYMLMMVRKVLFGGGLSSDNRQLRDMSPRDWASMIPLCVLIVVLGVYPKGLLDKMGDTLETYWSAQVPKAAATLVVPKPVAKRKET
jgi:NADH-quinone oxidoreductase subunit M